MNESTNKEKVLKKVRSALLSKTANPFPAIDLDSTVFHTNDLPAEVNFAEKFMQLGGSLLLCENNVELMEMLLTLCDKYSWKVVFCLDKEISVTLTEFEFPHESRFEFDKDKKIDAVILKCSCLVSRTGEIIFSPSEIADEKIFSVAENIVVVAGLPQVKNDLKESLAFVKEKNNQKFSPFLSIVNPKSFAGKMFVLINEGDN